MNYYTVYLRKTDQIIAQGTAKECAYQLKLKSFNNIVSRVRKGKNKKYDILVEKYSDVMEEDHESNS